MTDSEQARAAYAKICGRLPECWRVVQKPEVGTWYDFYDNATGKYGQCMMRANGWHQAPRGENPTILLYLGAPGKQKWKETENHD